MFISNFTNTHTTTIEEAVYFTPNGCKGRRLKENLTHINAIFADFDFKPKEVTGDNKPDYKQFMLDLSDLPTPTYVVESGNGWHVYWCLEESLVVDDDNRTELTQQVEGMHRYIRDNYGSDGGAIDVLHLLRQPGFEHKKMPDHPFMVKVVEENDDAYTLDELLNAFPPVYKEVYTGDDSPVNEYDIKTVAIDVWKEKGAEVSFDQSGRLMWNGETTATFIGRNGSRNYIATTSEEYPYQGNATTYVSGVLGVSTKEAYKWLVDKYGSLLPVASLGLKTSVSDPCPERTAFVSHIVDPQWGDKDWMKQYKFLASEYALEFHNYFASVYPHLVYERGEDKIYWNYQEDAGVYVELNATEVRGLVLHLLRTEGLRDRATESNVRNVLARYRGDYKERGVEYGAFDSDDTWFHANNGWVNLETRVFESHTPARHSRVKSAVDYDAGAMCPTYDKFLEHDLHLKVDQVRVIDQFSGLSLTNDIKYQKMLTLLGRPGCGKSTLLNTWAQVLGEKAIEKKLPELTGEAMRFAGAQFVGATLCWFDEVDVKKSEMGNNLGTLITGETIQVERKGINGIVKANNTVKCVLTANRLPLTAEVGIYRRLIMVPIEVSFVENGTVDIDVPNRLKTEASGVLNRMITGLQDLRKMRGFTVIDGHEDLIEDYKASSDTIAEFLDEYFEVGSDEDFVETTVLYKSYKHFVDGNNFMRSITPQKFGKLLSTQPLSRFSHIEARRTKSARGWVGIKLKQEYEIDSYGDTIQAKKALNF